MTEPIEPPRDAQGRIDVHGTMQVITSVVEGWVREYPGAMALAAPPLAVTNALTWPVLIRVHSRFISRVVLAS